MHARKAAQLAKDESAIETLLAVTPGEDLRGDNQSNAVYAKQQAELHRAHGIFVLDNERRRADIRE